MRFLAGPAEHQDMGLKAILVPIDLFFFHRIRIFIGASV